MDGILELVLKREIYPSSPYGSMASKCDCGVVVCAFPKMSFPIGYVVPSLQMNMFRMSLWGNVHFVQALFTVVHLPMAIWQKNVFSYSIPRLPTKIECCCR